MTTPRNPVTTPLKHSRKKGFKNQQRDRANSRKKAQRGSGRSQEQLDLFVTETKQPKAKQKAKQPEPEPKEPFIVTPEKTAYYWQRNRYRLTCAYTDKPMGFPFFGDELEFILSHFKDRRSRVTDEELWPLAKKAADNTMNRRRVAA